MEHQEICACLMSRSKHLDTTGLGRNKEYGCLLSGEYTQYSTIKAVHCVWAWGCDSWAVLRSHCCPNSGSPSINTAPASQLNQEIAVRFLTWKYTLKHILPSPHCISSYAPSSSRCPRSSVATQSLRWALGITIPKDIVREGNHICCLVNMSRSGHHDQPSTENQEQWVGWFCLPIQPSLLPTLHPSSIYSAFVFWILTLISVEFRRSPYFHFFSWELFSPCTLSPECFSSPLTGDGEEPQTFFIG